MTPVARRRRGHRRLVAVALIPLVVMGVALAALAAGQLPGRGATPTEKLGSQVSDRRADLSKARTNKDRAAAADALAGEYANAAAGAGASDAPRLRRIADAYRRAADAARREDGSDYDDALASARHRERGLEAGSGDSKSDDPSDDEPDENDNGD